MFFYCGSPQYNLKLSFVRDSVTWLVLLREPHCCLCSGRLLVPPHAHRLAVAMRMRSVIGVSFTIAPNHLQDGHRSDSHLCETSTGRQSCFDLAPVHSSYGLSIRRPKQGLSFVFIRVRKRKRSPVRIPGGCHSVNYNCRSCNDHLKVLKVGCAQVFLCIISFCGFCA